MPIKHGNLYEFATCPGYGRYFISLIGGVWLRGIIGHYISKGGTGAHSVQKAGTVGHKGDGVRPAGGDGGRAGVNRENIFRW